MLYQLHAAFPMYNVLFIVDDINTIYQLCSFEEAITERDSNWCQFLNEENLQIIEYLNDLKVRQQILCS